VLAGGALITAGCSGGGGTGADGSATSTTVPAVTQTGATTMPTAAPATLASTVAEVRRQLRGIPQHGLVVGSAGAPVTIVEYGHFACPSCAVAHATVVPAVIERFVRTGKATLEFRGVGGNSPSPSRDLALSASAAAEQRRGWDFVQLAYLRDLARASTAQGATAERPARLAAALGLDMQAWDGEIAAPARLAEVVAAANVAAVARFTTFPVFLVRARATPERPFVVLTNPGSVRAFAAAIAKAETPDG
jgi:protein-disulfide isomerase